MMPPRNRPFDKLCLGLFFGQPHLPANQPDRETFGGIFLLIGDDLKTDHRSGRTEDHLRELIQVLMDGIDEGPIALSDADNYLADLQFPAPLRGPPGKIRSIVA